MLQIQDEFGNVLPLDNQQAGYTLKSWNPPPLGDLGKYGYPGAILVEVAPQVNVAPAYVPQVISRFQGKAALAQLGKLDEANLIVAAANDPITTLAWSEVTEFRRTSPLLNTMAEAIWPEDTQAELDNLFTIGAAIVV